jgi:hypothetical protein
MRGSFQKSIGNDLEVGDDNLQKSAEIQLESSLSDI